MVASLRVTQCAVFIITQGGTFTYSTVWQFLRVRQCGIFTCCTVWLFYV